MLKSRLGQTGGSEQPSARDRLTRHTGVQDPLANLQPEAVEEEAPIVVEDEAPAVVETQEAALQELAAESQARGDYGPQHGTEPDPPKRRGRPVAAAKPAKVPAAKQYQSAADVRQALKEHEADVKAMKLRHAEEIQHAKAKHVDLSTKLFDFVSQ